MADDRPSRAVTIATNLATLALVLGAIIFVLITVTAVVGGINGGNEVGVRQEASTRTLDSLPDEVIVPETVPVLVRIEDATLSQSLLDLATSLLPGLALLAIIWLVRGLLLSVRSGDPFVAANVRRLRLIGFILAVGAPIGAYIVQLLEGALADSSSVGELANSYTLSGNPVLAGLGVFVLAEVFGHGVRLREDLEGTV
jgi:hypothetical protein